MDNLIDELKSYYLALDDGFTHDGGCPSYSDILHRIEAVFTAEQKSEPEKPAVLQKARLHELIADEFEPVIFPHSPFYFEMGVKPAIDWGATSTKKPSSLLGHQRYAFFWKEHPKLHDELEIRQKVRLDTHPGPVDFDHHYFNYTKVLSVGLEGVLCEAENELSRCCSADETAFVRAAIISTKAVMRIAEKFAAKAVTMLEGTPDAESRKFLRMIADTAAEVPKRAPRTFYEGLAAMWFLREVCGSLESIGISVVGHPDRLLIGLYRADIASGRLTRAEAEDLVARWLLPTDQKFNLDRNSWPETSSTLMLGGCDSDGKAVFNEITVMMIEQHHRLNLINPKLNCRYGHNSPPEYLRLIADKVLVGHNNFALINDDILIPANVKAGKTVEDCRNYGAGGCQETIVEGVEHSAGAYYYLNLPMVMNLFLNPTAEQQSVVALCPEEDDLSSIDDFETFYARFSARLKFYVCHGIDARAKCGIFWPEVNPCPFFSASLYDCLKSHRDYTAGGGRYNPSGISLCGFGTLVDSLFAVKRLCFEERLVSVGELAKILSCNWNGFETLRQQAIKLPKFGHGHHEVDELAARLAGDLAEYPHGHLNERGGPAQMSFFVYYEFVWGAFMTSATPDGRADKEFFSQGVSPGRLQTADEITSAINSLRAVDFSDYPGNAVLDLQLPLGKIRREELTAVIRTAWQAGIPTLQFNCVSVRQLKDAQENPEKYPGLTVRISGLSARFVALTREVQDEIIARNVFS